MFENQIPPRAINPVLKDYAAACESFAWEQADREFSWHTTGRLNIAHEAIGRFAENPQTASQPCLIYSLRERREVISYAGMHRLACRFASMLRELGVAAGDRVFIFLPNIPELYVALAGCAALGAVIVPLYEQFRAAALVERMLDAQGSVLVTTPAHRSHIPAGQLPHLKHRIIVGPPQSLAEDEICWAEAMAQAAEKPATVWLEPEAPLFLIYTSGGDGRPIGLVHVHDAMRGYLMTGRWVLDLRLGDVLWTQAQPGWFMNVVYNAFAPWLCGAASFITGRVSRAEEFYRNVQENRISVVYTTPTVYRLLLEDEAAGMAESYDLKSLRHLASVLEPLYPDLIYAVMRLLDIPIHDTWWTAETGMITLANFPCLPIKPGYLGKPVPGITAQVHDAGGCEPPPFTMGAIALRQGWPAMARGVWRNEQAYSSFVQQPPWFHIHDTAFVDYDGYFYHQGRTDDVIITAAGKTGFAEIERALVGHAAVREAAVIRSADEYGRKKIKAFVSLQQGYGPSPQLQAELTEYLLQTLAPDLKLAAIEFRASLPKDSCGRLMRRVLKTLELGLPVGDLRNLNPGCTV